MDIVNRPLPRAKRRLGNYGSSYPPTSSSLSCRYRRRWTVTWTWSTMLGLWLVLVVVTGPIRVSAMTRARREELREETREMFRLGYDGYMKYAYPADELRPLTCKPLKRDPDSSNIGVNDVHANASITLLDVLTSLPLLLPSAFPSAVHKVATEISFDSDVKIQVFEMTIRALGSLLSTYQRIEKLPLDPVEQGKELGLKQGEKVDLKIYQNRMLELALDLGQRLLPAFKTPTGIPVSRINLRKGVDKGEVMETCTAGAGSLVLEFTLLSRLTGDPRFEEAAHRAFMALWHRRSEHDLLGNGIGAGHGHWLSPGLSGIGAGIDSYFEYALKAGIMLDDSTYLDVFQDAYAAIMTHIRTSDGAIYRPVQLRLLQPPAGAMIDSLSAFFPSVQVLFGDLESAIRNHLVWYHLWTKYDAIPESWEFVGRRLGWAGWPGRPEFIESTYYLYQATKDDFYLRVGERVLNDMRRRTMTSCGFATLKNVETGEVEDRMESFVLSETLKYLYLLFADVPFSHSNTVFTTEGHSLTIPRSLLTPPTFVRRSLHAGEDLICPVYTPFKIGSRGQGQSHSQFVVGIEGRDDFEYTRLLVFGPDAITDSTGLIEGGSCVIPEVPRYSFDIALSPVDDDGSTLPPLDSSPGPDKVWQTSSGDFMISNVDGLRLGVRWRVDGKGYDVSSIGPHRVRPGQHVFVADPQMEGYLPHASAPPLPPYSPAEIIVKISIVTAPSSLAAAGETSEKPVTLLSVIGATATFGRVFDRTLSASGVGIQKVFGQKNNDGGGSETKSKAKSKFEKYDQNKNTNENKSKGKSNKSSKFPEKQMDGNPLTPSRSNSSTSLTSDSSPTQTSFQASSQSGSQPQPPISLTSPNPDLNDSSSFIFGNGNFLLCRPHDRTACSKLSRDKLDPPPLKSSKGEMNQEDRFVLFVERGECTFVTKAQRAIEIGASGMIIYDSKMNQKKGKVKSEDEEVEDETNVLLRPSAENESEQVLEKLEGLSIVFVERAVGEFVNQIYPTPIQSNGNDSGGEKRVGGRGGEWEKEEGMFKSEERRLVVAVEELEKWDGSSILKDGGRDKMGKRKEQERVGRLVVNDHEIWNLAVVERD